MQLLHAVPRIPIQAPGLTADGVVTGAAARIPADGVMTLASVLPIAAGLKAAIRARIEVLDPAGAVLFVVWRGFARASGIRPSSPGIPVSRAWQVRLVAGGSSSLVGTVTVNGTVEVHPEIAPYAGVWHDEPSGGSPGCELGDHRTLTIPQPAVATSPATQTVGAGTISRPRAADGSLTTDANAGGRRVLLSIDDGATLYGRTKDSIQITASRTTEIGAMNGSDPAPDGNATPNFWVVLLLGNVLFRPGHRWQISGENLKAGDQFAATVVGLEEWAVDP